MESFANNCLLARKLVENPVRTHDLQATILHLMGYDHARLSVPIQGLNQKLTGVNKAKVIKDLLA